MRKNSKKNWAEALSLFKEAVNKSSKDFDEFINEVKKDAFISCANDFVKKAEKEWNEFTKTDFFKKAEKEIIDLKDKIIKEKNGRMEIFIPYDRNKDTLFTSINDNFFEAVVKAEDGSNERKTVLFLPHDIDVHSETHSYDSNQHLMIVSFNKIKR